VNGKKINVLIFPCGSAAAIELHSALTHAVNVKVFGASSIEDHGRFVFRNYIGGLPFIQDDKFIFKFNEIVCGSAIDAVFPTHDTVAEFFAIHRDEIACRVIVSESTTARICRHKKCIYDAFKDCRFTPRVYSDPGEVQSFPVFLKPDIGEGGRNTRLVKTKEELTRTTELYPDLLIQENLPGEELTVDSFTDRHGKLRFMGPRLRSRVFYGLSVNSKTVPLTTDIQEIGEEINRRLHLRGLWFFQIKRDTEGCFKLMEISVRTAGTMLLYRHLGVNLPLLSVYDAMDMDVEIMPNDFDIEVDRAIFSRFNINYEYDAIYLDFDDTVVREGEVNRYVLMLLYQAARQGKKVILLTRHEGDIYETLEKNKIHRALFTQIRALAWNEEKSDLISSRERAIFIDNAFQERKKIKERIGIPVFDIDAVSCLIDWRE
jgi:hypothetical protein